MRSETEQVFNKVYQSVMRSLHEGEVYEESQIRDLCRNLSAIWASHYKIEFDAETVIREIESKLIVWQEESNLLHNDEGHIEWLDTRKDQIEWLFWERYRQFIELTSGLPPAVVSRLDKSTDVVLGQFEDPNREGVWDRRGLVVGEVQSGKTGHYIGLICKAADAGYKLIVVLAGLHDSLRSQTQLRVDEGFLGFDSQRRNLENNIEIKIGAGLEFLEESRNPPKAGSITTSAEDGDFSRAVANQANFQIHGPIILVIKKNTSILKNFTKWITTVHGVKDHDSENLIVKDLPILVIDDEADNASVNTKSNDSDPARTNAEIRKLLNSFQRSAYVGYTATPFANIFMDSNVNVDYGKDLFPRDFIENVKAPNNYFGAARVFGLNSADVQIDGLPIKREVDDYFDWLPDKHKKGHVPLESDFPNSLLLAIKSYVLTVAIRSLRENRPHHNSMLIHVTRFKAVQEIVSEQVEHHLASIVKRMRYGDGDSTSIWAELEALYVNDFLSTSEYFQLNYEAIKWEDVKKALLETASKIEVKTINGNSEDALEYFEKRKSGISVIVIGGDKLSRGLTLEGLSISYYLRASRMYDTLLQMGRWFGYRPKYEDLCRLYTTRELMDWYSEIALADTELRDEFELMQKRGQTPENYGLKVRTSISGLLITSPSKMRSAEKVDLTYNDMTVITTSFDIDNQVLQRNLQALSNFVQKLDRNSKNDPNWGIAFNTQDANLIVDFLRNYKSDIANASFQPTLIADYINTAQGYNQLTYWDVVIASPTNSNTSYNLNNLQVNLTTRKIRNNYSGNTKHDIKIIEEDGSYKIKTALSPSHEKFGLSEQELLKLDAFGISDTETFDENSDKGNLSDNSGAALKHRIRAVRDPKKGLILIYLIDNSKYESIIKKPMVGLVLSFPNSDKIVKCQYQANEIYRSMNLEPYLGEEEDQ